jgi:hypothetical protein
MESGGSQQRDSVVESLMFHQGLDPPHRVGCADGLVLRAQDEVETMARARQSALPDQSGDSGGQIRRLQVERSQRLCPGEKGASVNKPVLDESFIETISGLYAKNDKTTMFLHTIP